VPEQVKPGAFIHTACSVLQAVVFSGSCARARALFHLERKASSIVEQAFACSLFDGPEQVLDRSQQALK
jgi:hypothetical protein